MKGKHWAFCISLPFACEKNFADDLLHPGIVLARITPASKKEVTVLIIKMKSIHQLEKTAPTSLSQTLKIQSFQLPVKAVRVSGETAQQGKFMWILFDMGLSLADCKSKCKKSGFSNEDMMETDDAFANFNNKTTRTAN
jgi:hypothetical protein